MRTTKHISNTSKILTKELNGNYIEQLYDQYTCIGSEFMKFRKGLHSLQSLRIK